MENATINLTQRQISTINVMVLAETYRLESIMEDCTKEEFKSAQKQLNAIVSLSESLKSQNV